MSDLKEWRHIANHSTSGDMVWDILMDWQKSEDALRELLEVAKQGLIYYRDYAEAGVGLGSGVAEIALAEINKKG